MSTRETPLHNGFENYAGESTATSFRANELNYV